MSWQDVQVLLNNTSVTVGESETDTPISEIFTITNPRALTIDLEVSEIAKVTGITGKLQTRSCGGDWITGKTFAISTTQRIVAATFLEQAETDSGDYVHLVDGNGDSWAVAADLTGADAEPNGAIWTAIPAANKALADISAAVTAEDVAAAFDTAFNSLTDFDTVFTSDWTFVPGSITFAEIPIGSASSTATPHNEAESGAGSITTAVNFPGDSTPSPNVLLISADTADTDYLPLRKQARLVVSSGSGDSVTISSVVITN